MTTTLTDDPVLIRFRNALAQMYGNRLERPGSEVSPKRAADATKTAKRFVARIVELVATSPAQRHNPG
jgi:hypothetical protein